MITLKSEHELFVEWWNDEGRTIAFRAGLRTMALKSQSQSATELLRTLKPQVEKLRKAYLGIEPIGEVRTRLKEVSDIGEVVGYLESLTKQIDALINKGRE